MTQFIIAYEVEGATYTCKVDAPTFADAQRHLISLASTGRVSGEHVMDVPIVGTKTWLAGETLVTQYLTAKDIYKTENDDTALLRQALEALEKSGARMAFCEEKMHEIYPALEKQSSELGMSHRVVEVLGIGCCDIKPIINALRERLGEKT